MPLPPAPSGLSNTRHPQSPAEGSADFFCTLSVELEALKSKLWVAHSKCIEHDVARELEGDHITCAELRCNPLTDRPDNDDVPKTHFPSEELFEQKDCDDMCLPPASLQAAERSLLRIFPKSTVADEEFLEEASPHWCSPQAGTSVWHNQAGCPEPATVRNIVADLGATSPREREAGVSLVDKAVALRKGPVGTLSLRDTTPAPRTTVTSSITEGMDKWAIHTSEGCSDGSDSGWPMPSADVVGGLHPKGSSTRSGSYIREFKGRKEWAVDLAYVSEATGRSRENTAEDLQQETLRVIEELKGQRLDSCLSVDIKVTKLVSMMRGSADTSARERCLPLRPHSKRRLMWVVLSIVFMVYDAVMTPLVLFVIPDGTISVHVDLAVIGFWFMDMAMTFVTCTEVGSEIVMNFRGIAWQYMRTWFMLDLLAVLPECVMLLLVKERGGFALFRVVRLLRLIRFFKVKDLAEKVMSRGVHAVGFLSVLHLTELIFAFLLLNHFIACFWLQIGRSTSGWFETAGLPDVSTTQGYLLALHWSITQFHGSMDVQPSNAVERIFALVVLIVGMLTFSIFVSMTTGMLFNARQAHRKYTEHTRRLNTYFLRHEVSPELTLAVRRYAEANRVWEGEEGVHEKELLHSLPEQTQKSLLMEVRSPIVERHRLFAWLQANHVTAFRDIIHSALTPMQLHSGHSIFLAGDACHSMLFLESGQCRYMEGAHCSTIGVGWLDPKSQTMRQISRMRAGTAMNPKMWICEHAMWVSGWQNRGSLFTVLTSSILCVESCCLATAAKQYPAVYIDMVLYARWVLDQLRNLEETLMSDLWMPDLWANDL